MNTALPKTNNCRVENENHNESLQHMPTLTQAFTRFVESYYKVNKRVLLKMKQKTYKHGKSKTTDPYFQVATSGAAPARVAWPKLG